MLVTEYRSIYQELIQESQPRFVVFEPIDRSGWGNRLRGLTLCALLAIATRRILVVRDFLIEEHLLPPEGCQWRYAEWSQRFLEGADDTFIMDLHMATHKFDPQEWESFGIESMETLFPARILVLQESIGFFDRLVVNPHYSELWKRLGLDINNKIQWIGATAQDFFSRPTEKLDSAVKRLKKRLRIDSPGDSWLVQYRTFFDIGSPNMGALEAFIVQVEEAVARAPRAPASFYVTTDDQLATETIVRRLRVHARAVGSPVRVVHTGGLHVGAGVLLERALRKTFRREFYFFDWWKWVPERYRPRPHTATLAEWWFIGEFGVAVSTFTSFAVYAMARTGNQARLLRFEPSTGLLGPLKNGHYGF